MHLSVAFKMLMEKVFFLFADIFLLSDCCINHVAY